MKQYLHDSEFHKNRVIQSITTYVDYLPYVAKLKSGHTNQITPGRPDYYITTTGTSGVPKIIPFHINKQFGIGSSVIIPFLRPKIMYNLLFGKICYFFKKEKELLYNGIICTNGATRQMLNCSGIYKSKIRLFYFCNCT
jgi:hypothetical protein